MRILVIAILTIAVAAAALVLRGPDPSAGNASNQREAPLIDTRGAQTP
jgi:hypothetical protein